MVAIQNIATALLSILALALFWLRHQLQSSVKLVSMNHSGMCDWKLFQHDWVTQCDNPRDTIVHISDRCWRSVLRSFTDKESTSGGGIWRYSTIDLVARPSDRKTFWSLQTVKGRRLKKMWSRLTAGRPSLCFLFCTFFSLKNSSRSSSSSSPCKTIISQLLAKNLTRRGWLQNANLIGGIRW